MFAQFFRRYFYALDSHGGEHFSLEAIMGDCVADGEDILVEDHNTGAVQFCGDDLSILEFEFGIGMEEIDRVNDALDAHESLVDQNGIVIVPPVQHGGQERVGGIPRRGGAGGKQEKYETQEKKSFHGFLKPRSILKQISCHNSEIDM
jgi:hypothetical protein